MNAAVSIKPIAPMATATGETGFALPAPTFGSFDKYPAVNRLADPVHVIFTSVMTLILRISLARPRVVLVVAVIAGAAASAVGLHRTRQAPRAPLIFDDELPTEVHPLRLNAD